MSVAGIERQMMDRKINGFWAIVARKHLKEFVDYSDNVDVFDGLNVAGIIKSIKTFLQLVVFYKPNI